jgi:DNA-binding transcriptional regulator GbsR (MarR family)
LTVTHKQENPLDIFIEGWGKMGTHWGVGKVMAEIQALLYLSPRPLGLDEMSERLKTSRSNISLNVRALQDLGVVEKAITPGDRRDYYRSDQSLVTVARRLAAKKKKRELDPALDIIDRTIDACAEANYTDIDTDKLYELKDLIETIGAIFDTFISDELEDSPTAQKV